MIEEMDNKCDGCGKAMKIYDGTLIDQCREDVHEKLLCDQCQEDPRINPNREAL